jgi:hypothetical protein
MYQNYVSPEKYFEVTYNLTVLDDMLGGNTYSQSSIPYTLFRKAQSLKESIKNSTVYTLLEHSLGLSNYQVSCITSKELQLQKNLTEELQKFEEEILYPYSETEDLMIRHGRGNAYKYESFFCRLGKPYFYIARNKRNTEVTKTIKGKEETFLRQKGEIAAVACCVLRKIRSPNGNFIKTWYVCDLKVGKKYLGEHLPMLIMRKGMWRLLQCPRGFGICKNQPNGQTAKSARIVIRNSPFSGLQKVPFTTYVFSAKQIQQMESNLGTKQFQEIERVFRKNRYIKNGRFTFVSNEGAKEYYIRTKRTGQIRRQKMLHAITATGPVTAKEGYGHVFFALKGTSLDDALQKVGQGEPQTQSGILVSFRMDRRFRISSAEI